MPYLSIVIPAYNEERRMPVTLETVAQFIQAQPYQSEVIIVENGSHDRTLEIVQSFAKDHPAFRVIHEARRGKGRAVRTGMLAARGEFRFMADADFSMPVTEINRFLPPNQNGGPLQNSGDILIASREAPGAVRYNEPVYRHFVGRVFNTLIRLLALPDLHDTQCGFKCFTARAAEDLFPRQTLAGWSFDVEILFIARRLGYQIKELPIPWYFNADSKVRVFHDSLRMAVDLLSIRKKALQGVYEQRVSEQA